MQVRSGAVGWLNPVGGSRPLDFCWIQKIPVGVWRAIPGLTNRPLKDRGPGALAEAAQLSAYHGLRLFRVDGPGPRRFGPRGVPLARPKSIKATVDVYGHLAPVSWGRCQTIMRNGLWPDSPAAERRGPRAGSRPARGSGVNRGRLRETCVTVYQANCSVLTGVQLISSVLSEKPLPDEAIGVMLVTGGVGELRGLLVRKV